jgi:hypothetical protein
VQLPRFWIIMQALIMVFVAIGMGIAAIRL